MKHAYIDRYSELDSYIHRLDPRIKIAGLFTLILSIILTAPESFNCFGLYVLFIAILIALSKIPPSFIFKRSLVVIPFVLMIAIFIPFLREGEIAGAYSFGSLKLTVTYGGLMIFWNVLIKSYLSILSMIVLVASTPFSDFLKALEKMKIPQILVMLLSFIYRYIFVLEDELMKMKQAKEARWVGGSRWLAIRAMANMVGVLFIRAYERGENVYLAMCARGFTGEMRTMHELRVKRSDVYFILVLAGVLAGIRALGT